VYICGTVGKQLRFGDINISRMNQSQLAVTIGAKFKKGVLDKKGVKSNENQPKSI
jgi:hypothetical protein